MVWRHVGADLGIDELDALRRGQRWSPGQCCWNTCTLAGAAAIPKCPPLATAAWQSCRELDARNGKLTRGIVDLRLGEHRGDATLEKALVDALDVVTVDQAQASCAASPSGTAVCSSASSCYASTSEAGLLLHTRETMMIGRRFAAGFAAKTRHRPASQHRRRRFLRPNRPRLKPVLLLKRPPQRVFASVFPPRARRGGRGGFPWCSGIPFPSGTCGGPCGSSRR